MEDLVGHAEERGFLARLSAMNKLAVERPRLEGAAVVITIDRGALRAEVVIEVRLAGEAAHSGSQTKRGLLWVYLQNTSDTPLPVRVPAFILTGKLKLPWQVGTQPVFALQRFEYSEALSWILPLDGDENMELLCSEILVILEKCRTLMSSPK